MKRRFSFLKIKLTEVEKKEIQDIIFTSIYNILHISKEDIIESKRYEMFVIARKIFCVIYKQITGESITNMGKEIKRNHSTVVYYINHFIFALEYDPIMLHAYCSVIEDLFNNNEKINKLLNKKLQTIIKKEYSKDPTKDCFLIENMKFLYFKEPFHPLKASIDINRNGEIQKINIFPFKNKSFEFKCNNFI